MRAFKTVNGKCKEVVISDEKLREMFLYIVNCDIDNWCKNQPHCPEEETEDEYQDACMTVLGGGRYNSQKDIDEHWTKPEQTAFMNYFKREGLMDDSSAKEEYFGFYYDQILTDAVNDINADDWVCEDEDE